MYILNLKRALPDQRDWPLSKLLGDPPASLPTSDNHIRVMQPPIRDQGALGSCTGFAYFRIHRLAHRLLGLVDNDLSPLFEYYNERDAQGTVGQDSGSTIKQSIQSAAANGICDEVQWPYNISVYTQRPPASAYANAALDKAIQYYTVNNDLGLIKQAINAGYAVSIGITVYPSFQGQNGGVIPMPGANENPDGGHNIVLDTYDDVTQRFGFANSWGVNWGMAGFGTISYDYITKFGFDGWVLQKVQGVTPTPAPTPDPTPTPAPSPTIALSVTDDKVLASISASWNPVNGATSYLVQVGFNANNLSQSFNVGTQLGWKASYPKDANTRYMVISALAANGSTKLATSNAVSFGPATPTPTPVPTPVPDPVTKLVKGVTLTTDANEHIIGAIVGYTDNTTKAFSLI